MTALAEGLAPSRQCYCDYYPTPLPGRQKQSSCPAHRFFPKRGQRLTLPRQMLTPPARNPWALPQHDTESSAPGSALFRLLPEWGGNGPASGWQVLFLPMLLVPAQLGGSGLGAPQINRKDIQALPASPTLHPVQQLTPSPTLPTEMLWELVETAFWLGHMLGPSTRLHLSPAWTRTGVTGHGCALCGKAISLISKNLTRR